MEINFAGLDLEISALGFDLGHNSSIGSAGWSAVIPPPKIYVISYKNT